MGEEQPETLLVKLNRNDSGQSWGFRLQGGMDFNTPLSVQVVQPRSVAERSGLRAGDGIIRINNMMTDGLSHEQAKMEIIRSCNDIDMLIIRGAVQIWRPKVTPMNELKPENKPQPVQTATGDQIYTTQKTSLAKDRTDENCTIGSSYNRSARPFGGGSGGGGGQPMQLPNQQPQYGGQMPNYGSQYGEAPGSPKRAVPNVVHSQFNTPIGLYSAGNIAQSYKAQTAGIEKEMQNLDVNDAPVGMKLTGTYQRLDSSDNSPNKSMGTSYGSPQGDDASTSCLPSSDSPTSLQNATSDSSERLQPENGVIEDEHASVVTNTLTNDSQPSGFRSVTAPTASSNPPPPPKTENMHCTGCGNIVTGVFVRIKGMPYHDKCFKCARCGMFLKQKGYFIIEGQLLCETHARQNAQAPGDNLRCAGAVYR